MKTVKKLLSVFLFCLLATLFLGFNADAASNTVYGGVDYSAVYNYQYYKAKYADLRVAFGDDTNAYINHFVTSGMSEGRQASEDFSVSYYQNKYSDLRAAFGADKTAYYHHYISSGRREGRIAVSPSVYNGVDYGTVYSYEYYKAKYSDLRAAFGNNAKAYINHFVNDGMREGRQASESFNLSYYKGKYADLRVALGSDNSAYYRHYMNYGRAEGRMASPPYIYNGIDYSAVYNYEYYKANYSDLRAVFGDNAKAYINHFVNDGIREGRQASRGFDYNYYKESNGDLRAAFGDNAIEYYSHYMYYGKAEGRRGTALEYGIDVSKHQGRIDWESVKRSGIDFAIIRLGYGDDLANQTDTYAEYNMSECERLNIPYGVYLYSYALNLEGTESVESEIAHTKRVLGDHRPQLGIWYDIEDESQDDLTPTQLTDYALHYFNGLKDTGLELGIYANLWDLNNRLEMERLADYNCWVAHYSETCGYDGNYQIWQYTSDGSIDGIDGRVDMNIKYY